MNKFRSDGTYNRVANSNIGAIECLDESLADQSEAAECDINVLVARFGLTGTIPQNVHAPTYVDYDDVFDFRSAMDAINLAEESFMAMPADVRGRFANDPATFVEFCSKPENLEEMRKIGLADPAPVKVPDPPPVPTTV